MKSNEPRDVLREAIQDGTAVLFAGPGLSAFAGYPNRRQQIRQMIARPDFPNGARHEIESAINDGSIDEVMELLLAVQGREWVLHAFLEMMNQVRWDLLPPAFMALSQIPFRHVISASVDELIEIAFASRRPIVIDGVNESDSVGSDVSMLFSGQHLVIAKIFGRLSHPGSIRLGSEELARYCYLYDYFPKLLASLLSSSTVFFAGMSIGGINSALEAIRGVGEVLARGSHIALLPDTPRNRGARAARLERRFGIRSILVPYDGSYEAVANFLDELAYGYPAGLYEPNEAFWDVQARIEIARPIGRLERLRLRDIGPFKNLELEFTPGWTVLLGDNGTGKSTILRAIALAVCGEQSAQFSEIARRLLRSGGSGVGSIELTVDGKTHQVDLRRTPSGVSISCETVGLLDQGIKLVLGFPAMRGVSGRPNVAQTAPGTSKPAIADVAPIVLSVVDSRLDDVRQWLVNVEARRQASLRDRFFKIISDFLPGTDITFSRISDSFDVLVKVGDEEIPIEQLSQGMSSLLAWVGVTLQRLTEVYGEDEDALSRSVLLLVDELDAHLHPEWQRRLVPIIQKHFPSLQMIATTHSPLVVSALDRNSVIAIGHEDGEVQIRKADEELLGLRSDQVLTSDLFGLVTTRSVPYVQKSDELDSLIARDDLTPDEVEVRDSLSRELDSMTIPGDTPEARADFRRRQEQTSSAELDPETAAEGARIIDALLTEGEDA